MGIHKFIKAILNSEEIIVYGDGTQTRDFTYIDDVIEANLSAIACEIKGDVFNIGGGSRISLNELIKLIEEITGKKANLKHMENQKGDVRDTLADTSKAKELFGWRPKIGITEGLEKYIDWFMKNL